MEKLIRSICVILAFFIPISITYVVLLSKSSSNVESMNNQLYQMQSKLSMIEDSLSQLTEKESENLVLDYNYTYQEESSEQVDAETNIPSEQLLNEELENEKEEPSLVKIRVYLKEYTVGTKVYILDGEAEYPATLKGGYFETEEWVRDTASYVKIVNGDKVVVEFLYD